MVAKVLNFDYLTQKPCFLKKYGFSVTSKLEKIASFDHIKHFYIVRGYTLLAAVSTGSCL